MGIGINRYIVGCKYISTWTEVEPPEKINRYIVGCKFTHAILIPLYRR